MTLAFGRLHLRASKSAITPCTGAALWGAAGGTGRTAAADPLAHAAAERGAQPQRRGPSRSGNGREQVSPALHMPTCGIDDRTSSWRAVTSTAQLHGLLMLHQGGRAEVPVGTVHAVVGSMRPAGADGTVHCRNSASVAAQAGGSGGGRRRRQRRGCCRCRRSAMLPCRRDEPLRRPQTSCSGNCRCEEFCCGSSPPCV